MAGIHGSRQMPAYSIVLQGAYKTDEDHGNHFYYTGSGGYQNNKHIKDQVLEGANLSLAASCDAFLDTNGAEARDWRKSAPIRVIRGSKLKRRSSLFAPENLRYDGIYKLVRYWKELVPEGFFIWRFHFQRDDVEPAPWTSKGCTALDDSQASASNPTPHFGRSQTFSALDHLIRLDIQNQRLWDVIRSLPTQSTHQFLTQVRQTFTCKVCFDLVEATAPCTTPCGHNFCWSCLHASARQNRGRCPHCKKRISKFFSDGNAAGTGSGSSNPLLNSALSDILLALRPALDCET
ncbi:ubiquitin-like with PHD and RING finger domains 2 [Massospora cicadina]|nr:ubiquitin-like with PHD and RING finger domains 2 [Massospora cicadina]